MNNEERREKVYECYQSYYKRKKEPKEFKEFWDILLEKNLFYESQFAEWDLIENYMYHSEIVTEKYLYKAGECINILMERLAVSEKEVADAISRALIEGRIEIVSNDLGAEGSFDSDPYNKIFQIVKIIQVDFLRRGYKDYIGNAYIRRNCEEYVDSWYTRSMIYILKEEDTIQKRTKENLRDIEKQLEAIYAKFLELAGILIAIFSVIGLNLLAIKEIMGMKTIVAINCMIVFSLSILCLLIEVLILGKKWDKRVTVVLIVGTLAFIVAVCLAVVT